MDTDSGGFWVWTEWPEFSDLCKNWTELWAGGGPTAAVFVSEGTINRTFDPHEAGFDSECHLTSADAQTLLMDLLPHTLDCFKHA